MQDLSNTETATKLARAYDNITQNNFKIDNYSLRPLFDAIAVSYRTMPEKQAEITNTLTILLPKVLKRFTTVESFNTLLSGNFLDLLSIYKLASSIPFTELISVAEKIINPNNTQTDNLTKKLLVQSLTKLLTINFDANGMTEELQQSGLGMLEICRYSASNICSSEQTDFFTRLGLTTTSVAHTTLSSLDNPVTTANASIYIANTTTASELESNYSMSVELTNATITSEPINPESRRFSPLFLGTRLGLESGLGLTQGLTLFANDKLFKRFEGENPSFLRKIPSKVSRSIISSAINLGRYPISGRIVNPSPIEDCVENLFIYFGSNLMTSTAISASIIAINSAVEKFLGRGRIAQLINLITHAHTISITMLVMSEDFQENPGTASLGLALNWFVYIASYSLMNVLFSTSRLEKTTSFYKNFGEELIPIDSSSDSDKDSCTSDRSIKSLYFIKEEKLNEIKKGLDSIMANLSDLHIIYVKNNDFLMQTKEKLPEGIPNTTINESNLKLGLNEINLKIELVEQSIEQLNLYKTRLDDDHSAACIAFASAELVTNKSVNGLHALLKEIRRILKDLKSKLDKINGIQELPDAIQTPINDIRNQSDTITGLITTLFSGYDKISTGVKFEKKSNACSFFIENTSPSSVNDNFSNNEEPIYIDMSFKQ